MGEKRKRVLCIGLFLVMLTTVFLVGMPSVRADENYDHTYTDKWGDVSKQGEPTTTEEGNQEVEENVDIIEISSLKSENNVTLKMKVAGWIDNWGPQPGPFGSNSYIKYILYLDTNDDGATDYRVVYCARDCDIYIGEEGYSGEDISDKASGSGTDTLTVIVPLTLLNNTTTLNFASKAGSSVCDQGGDPHAYGYFHYEDNIMKPTGGGEKGGGVFIPGFETVFLLAAVGVSIVVMKKKHG